MTETTSALPATGRRLRRAARAAAGGPAGGGVRVAGLGRRFGDKWVVDDVSFDVAAGEFLSIVGPSGSGKSTTLRLLAGLDRPDSGDVEIGQRLVSSSRRGVSVAAERRNIGFVFQSYALWPHMTVFEHIAYPLKRSDSRSRREEKVRQTLELVGLAGLEGRYPAQLSGGQQQRVALARAVVKEPATMLLDEPLSNLDAELRAKMAHELRGLQRRLGFTAIYVTHDRVEALSLSDRVMVMNHGRAVDFGSPREVYEHPRDLFTGRFISGANTLAGTLVDNADGRLAVSLDGGTRVQAPTSYRADPVVSGDRVLVLARPETIRLAGPDQYNAITGVVESVTYFGAHSDVVVRAGSASLTARLEPAALSGLDSSDEVRLALPFESLVVLRDEDQAPRKPPAAEGK